MIHTVRHWCISCIALLQLVVAQPFDWQLGVCMPDSGGERVSHLMMFYDSSCCPSDDSFETTKHFLNILVIIYTPSSDKWIWIIERIAAHRAHWARKRLMMIVRKMSMKMAENNIFKCHVCRLFELSWAFSGATGQFAHFFNQPFAVSYTASSIGHFSTEKNSSTDRVRRAPLGGLCKHREAKRL